MFNSSMKFEDDDVFDDPGNSTTLSKIFGVSMDLNAEQHNSTLHYVAPKQKSPPTTTNLNTDHPVDESKPEWITILAKVVFAYKLVNHENIPQGKVGLAILKSNQNFHKIVLYRTKQLILATVAVSMDLQIYIKQQYLQFQDQNAIFWSIIFDDGERTEFLDQIKRFCQICDEPIVKTQQQQHSETEVKCDPNAATTSVAAASRSTKSTLISKMAKVGKPLPQLTSVGKSADISDSSDADEHIVCSTYKNTNYRTPIKMASFKNTCQELVLGGGQMSQNSSQNSLHPLRKHPNGPDDNFNMFLMENRLQNTEVKMNLTKLETKIERVLDKIDLINLATRIDANQSNSNDDREDELLELEKKLLDYKKENRLLRLEIRELSAKHGNGHDADHAECTKIEQQLRQEIIDINKENQCKIHELKMKCDQLNGLNAELNEKLIERNNQIEHFELLQSKSKVEIQQIQSNMNIEMESIQMKAQEQINALENKIKHLEQQQQQQQQVESKIEQKSTNDIDGIVKTIMNNLYQKLQQKFVNDSYSQDEILRLTGNLIKTETIAALNKKN